MPELPEVHTVVNTLRAQNIVGQRIAAVEVGWPATVGIDVSAFTTAVLRKSVVMIDRRGKNILLGLSPDGILSVHLRMSGRLYVAEIEAPRTGYERVVLTMGDSRQIRFYDPRKFGRFLYRGSVKEATSRLGIDPLSEEFTPDRLNGLFRCSRGRIKSLLLNQQIIAGMGNIYTDEALWRARLHPLRIGESLTVQETTNLYDAIMFVLHQGIQNHGTRLGGGKSNFIAHDDGPEPTNQYFLSVYGRTGERCVRCGTPIVRMVVAQRSTHICPGCQSR